MAGKRAHNPTKGPIKTFMENGHWSIKRQKTVILVCRNCNGKYVKTRNRQTVCLRCLLA